MAALRNNTSRANVGLDLNGGFRRGFQRFSDQTSMHGFHELYYAKTWFWRTIWILLLLATICTTIYQIEGAIDQYMHQSSTTLIKPLDNANIYYPPLKICIPHWLFWVNWTTVYDMGFTKEGMLYTLGIFTNIYSTEYFDEDEAKAAFIKDLKANFNGNLTLFFESIVKESYHFLSYNDTYSTLNYTKFNDDLLFCYVIPSDQIIALIEAQRISGETVSGQMSKSNTLLLTTYERIYNAIEETVNTIEYNSYIAEWIETTTFYYTDETDFRHLSKNYTHVYIPMVFYVDGFSDANFNIDPNMDIYSFTVKPSVHTWKNTKQNPCKVGSRSVISDKSCSFNCTARAYSESTGCVWFSDAMFFNEADINYCRNEIYFLNDTLEYEVSQYLLEFNGTSDNNSGSNAFELYAYEENMNRTQYQQLLSKCVANTCIEGCEVWSYDVTMSTKSIHSSVRTVARKEFTQIHIEYPIDGSILAMIETDSQTWESFIGNVGGLLGIWTGASILSMIQIFYLCCFDGTEGPSCNRYRPKRIHTVTLNRTPLPDIERKVSYN